MLIRSAELGRHPVHILLWLIVGAMIAIEALMSPQIAGLVGLGAERYGLYLAFAFHDVLFELARQEGQITAALLWSLVTYAFLHGGWLHLGLNAAALLGLGHLVTRIGGIGLCILVLVASAVAGALAFGIITDTQAPLVGASGAVFGLLGTVTAWEERALARAGVSRQPVWNRLAGLALINLMLYAGLGGMLAWEAHLGGFAAGWAIALMVPPRGIRPA